MERCACPLEKVPSGMLSMKIARGSFNRAEKREAGDKQTFWNLPSPPPLWFQCNILCVDSSFSPASFLRPSKEKWDIERRLGEKFKTLITLKNYSAVSERKNSDWEKVLNKGHSFLVVAYQFFNMLLFLRSFSNECLLQNHQIKIEFSYFPCFWWGFFWRSSL